MVGFLLFDILELKKEEVRTHEDTVLKTAGCKNFTGWIPTFSSLVVFVPLAYLLLKGNNGKKTKKISLFV